MTYGRMCKKAALSLPRSKRQEYLDLIHAGLKIGEAAERCGISGEAASGIINMNIVITRHLSRVAK